MASPFLLGGNPGGLIRWNKKAGRKVMDRHAPPEFLAPEFECPLCGANSRQMWLGAKKQHAAKTAIEGKELRIAQCTNCNKLTFWLDGKMVSPGQGSPDAFR